MTGVDKLRTDAGFTFRNGGMPVSGAGDFSVFVIDSGIDATHADLAVGHESNPEHTARRFSRHGQHWNHDWRRSRQRIDAVALDRKRPEHRHGRTRHTLRGNRRRVSAARSGSVYAGVAPGVKIVGSGGGAVILVLDALAGWEYGLAHQDLYNIRVITNSYGPLGGAIYDPESSVHHRQQTRIRTQHHGPLRGR